MENIVMLLLFLGGLLVAYFWGGFGGGISWFWFLLVLCAVSVYHMGCVAVLERRIRALEKRLQSAAEGQDSSGGAGR